ncbi:sugar-binding transcriptional regulator [Pararoseomonas indoligenes]|uniref:Sugar-binding transcriptional regulator n=1 Tax=Roseomonas indoligenes TaxID=2820811 RepID=A0A940S8A0_9PROT|nr:sugar-binding transcriptional regulator [Pararoseomonas indoligenes]MBP0493887.1 sugar-binding transcriptional regulator [Pararoseomonas indoligenes]
MSGSDEQLQVRVAWLYHMEDLTQGEIAARLGLTRLRVNRLLSECRQSGLVRVHIASRLESCVALENLLVREFGLAEAVIVPTPADGEKVPGLLGMAAADYLSRYLARTEVSVFGVGWGATLHETIRRLPPADLPTLWVTAMMGGLTQGLELNTFETAGELARRLNAQCAYLAAPIYAGSRASRDTLVALDVFAEAFERIRAVDLALLSLGDLSPRSLLVRHGLPGDVTVKQLRAAGAVGDVLGQFLDASGRPIDHPINERVIGLPSAGLAAVRNVVLAAGGRNKTAVIAAALRGGIPKVLVTDEDTAKAALSLAR